MENCKKLKVYRFDTCMRHLAKNDVNRKLRFQRSTELTEFKEKMINELSGSNFDEISEKHCIMSIFYSKNKRVQEPYKKEWMYSVFDIGVDMVKEKQGIQFECHWDMDYIGVPLDNEIAIKFFENNLPTFVKTVKKI